MVRRVAFDEHGPRVGTNWKASRRVGEGAWATAAASIAEKRHQAEQRLQAQAEKRGIAVPARLLRHSAATLQDVRGGGASVDHTRALTPDELRRRGGSDCSDTTLGDGGDSSTGACTINRPLITMHD